MVHRFSCSATKLFSKWRRRLINYVMIDPSNVGFSNYVERKRTNDERSGPIKVRGIAVLIQKFTNKRNKSA